MQESIKQMRTQPLNDFKISMPTQAGTTRNPTYGQGQFFNTYDHKSTEQLYGAIGDQPDLNMHEQDRLGAYTIKVSDHLVNSIILPHMYDKPKPKPIMRSMPQYIPPTPPVYQTPRVHHTSTEKLITNRNENFGSLQPKIKIRMTKKQVDHARAVAHKFPVNRVKEYDTHGTLQRQTTLKKKNSYDVSPDPEYVHDHGGHRKLKINAHQTLHDSNIHSNSLPQLAKGGKNSKLARYTESSIDHLPEVNPKINYNPQYHTERRIPKKQKLINKQGTPFESQHVSNHYSPKQLEKVSARYLERGRDKNITPQKEYVPNDKVYLV